MKHLLLFLLVCFSVNELAAQCGKLTTFKIEKGRDIKNGVASQEIPMDAKMTIDSQRIVLVVSMNGETETLDCEITGINFCEWQEYLKNGKAEYSIMMKIENEGPMKSKFILESENGNTTATFFEEEKPDQKLQFLIAEYTVTEIIIPNSTPDKPFRNSKKTKRKRKS